jgi:toxin-antitoxin system PIN domain toxin
MIYLPDVNVWIALAADKHIHHNVARHWFTGIQADQVLFCRITQLGFLRLLTNRHVMGEEVLSPGDAWRAYRALRADRRIGFLSEPAELPESWDKFTPKLVHSPNLWTDAYLCACCHAANYTLVTFDSRIPLANAADALKLTAAE